MSSDGTVDEEVTYEWVDLEPGERVIWEGKPHVYSLAPAIIVGIPLSVVLIGLVIMAWAWVARENTTYVITTEAVYRKRGSISRDVKRVDFAKIQNTSFRQGILGTHFDYGTVDVSTAGSEGAEVRFRAVPDPRAVQRQLNNRLERVTGETRPDDEERPDEIELLLEIRDELRAIRAAVDGTGTPDAETSEEDLSGLDQPPEPGSPE